VLRIIQYCVVLFVLLSPIVLLPTRQGDTHCDDVCRALERIERGDEVIDQFIHFPIYMSRFDLKVVNVDHYRRVLPPSGLWEMGADQPGGTALEIRDIKTGYAWLWGSRTDQQEPGKHALVRFSNYYRVR